MSWLRGLLRCPTCLEVASTCFRDTRSVIKKGFSLVLWSWCHRLFAKKSLMRSSSLQEGGSSGWSRIFAKILLYQILHFATSSGVSYSCKMWLTQLNIQLGHPTVNHSIVMVIFWIGVSIWVMLKERKIMVMSFIDNKKIFACRQCTTNMYVWIQVRQLLTSLGTAVQRAAAVSILN